jgi:hypothetical protein
VARIKKRQGYAPLPCTSSRRHNCSRSSEQKAMNILTVKSSVQHFCVLGGRQDICFPKTCGPETTDSPTADSSVARRPASRADVSNTRSRLRWNSFLMGTAKATHGRTDAAAQLEVRNRSHFARGLLSNDPDLLKLASEGVDAFVMRTAQRILDQHPKEILFNYCPQCGALAKTPKARQCHFCRHDWH